MISIAMNEVKSSPSVELAIKQFLQIFDSTRATMVLVKLILCFDPLSLKNTVVKRVAAMAQKI
jgi:hypothetical protein